MNIDCKTVNITKGSSGASVKILQALLTRLKYYNGLVDGNCGYYTVKAIKQYQSELGLTSDGVFGPKTCNASSINGKDVSSRNYVLTIEDFENMVDRFNQYLKTNKREPKICYTDSKYHFWYITNSKYKDMLTRVNNYIKKYNKKPATVTITFATITKTVTTNNNTSTSFIKQLEDAIGVFMTSTDNWINYKNAYNKIRGRGYLHYNDDKYSLDEEISRLKNREGINCADSSQLMYKLATDLGVLVRYVHVYCSSSKCGHIQLDVRKNTSNSWTRIDPAAAISVYSQYRWGSVWCSGAKVLSYNDAWLTSADDGNMD